MLTAAPAPAWAQGTRADYERATLLPARTRDKVFRVAVEPHWFADDTRVWYRNDLPAGTREFVVVDAVQGTRQPAFDHARLATALTKAMGKPAVGDHLPIDRLEFGDGPTHVILRGAGGAWRCDLRTYELHPAPPGDGGPAAVLPTLDGPRPSRRTGAESLLTLANRTQGEVNLFWIDPSGARVAYGTIAPGGEHRQHTFGGHVWLVTDRQGATLAVFEATDEPATAEIDPAHRPASQPATRPAGRRRDDAPASRPRGPVSPDGQWEVVVRDGNLRLRPRKGGEELTLSTDGTAGDGYAAGDVFWSPDSRKLVALRTRKGEERKVYYVESAPRDQLQPKLHSYDYLKPGDRIAQSKPHLFDLATRKEIPVSDALFANPWSLGEVRWEADNRRFTFLFNQRGHQVLRLLAIDAATGQVQPIINEQSPTFIDYAGKFYLGRLEKTGEIIWMSERDGWNHLYLYDAATGRVKSRITQGEWAVRGVDLVDEDRRQVWFRAGGIRPQQDPYYLHYCRVNFDGTGLVVLTEGDGTHRISYSPNRRFFVDSYSRVDLPPVTELRRAEDGKLICALESADWSALLKTGWQAPERFVAKGRDGQTDIYGVIYRPTTFDPQKKYPVIENIYAGPQGAHVPKGFRAFHEPQRLAELGFILVQIDGMGTSYRSKRFHDVCWKNLADAGFPDRVLWMKAAAAKYPYMDLSRVGIYGGSAGGQSALGALLFHGEIYKAAAADCGCHDNRMDKIWWNELWMGWPVGPHYAEQSNVTQAHRLQGKLLLTVGETDQNVDPASTMQVVNALIKANKDFELLVIPGGGHGSGETPYGIRRRQDFFVRSLWGVEPRTQP